jgi:hypothetical protein
MLLCWKGYGGLAQYVASQGAEPFLAAEGKTNAAERMPLACVLGKAERFSADKTMLDRVRNRLMKRSVPGGFPRCKILKST